MPLDGTNLILQLPRPGEPESAMLPGMAVPRPVEAVQAVQTSALLGMPDTSIGPVALQEPARWSYSLTAGNSLATYPGIVAGQSVMAFGATGDGVTDDGPAVQRALNAIGIASFPPGTFNIASPVVLPSNSLVIGTGEATKTIIRCGFNATDGLFVNTLYHTLGPFTLVPTTPANQTDHDFAIVGLTFDFSIQPGHIASFLLARKILVSDIRAVNRSTISCGSLRLLGCDQAIISAYIAENTQNPVDCWQGCSRIKVSDCSFTGILNASNGGLVNFNGQASMPANRCTSSDLQVVNTSFYLNNNIAIDVDSLAGGSAVYDVSVDNCCIYAVSGTSNEAVIGRGQGGRINLRGSNIVAQPGATISTSVTLGAMASAFAPYTGTGIITTTLGSAIIAVSLPNGTDLGPGNYVTINNGAGGPVTGNGVSLNGLYRVIGVSGPNNPAQSGNAITVQGPNNATGSGIVNVSTFVQGFYGCFSDCHLSDLIFDGTQNNVLYVGGSGHQLHNLSATPNPSPPSYRVFATLDSTQDYSSVWRAVSMSGIAAAPGTGPIQGGWNGDTVVEWQPYGVAPTLYDVGNNTILPGISIMPVGATGPGVLFCSITSGTATPSAIAPAGSIYLREGGTAGSRLYVSAGAGVWTGVAAV